MINNDRPAVDRADHLGRRHGPVARGPDALEVVLAEQVRQHRLLRRRPLRGPSSINKRSIIGQ